ncbi:ComF family protein [bacterium]|nr:ComF family protein [bacterium]
MREWAIWSLIYPETCARCVRPIPPSAYIYCDHCWSGIPRAEREVDEALPKYVEMLHAGFAYSDGNFTRDVVHALKYDGHHPLAKQCAAHLLLTIPIQFWDESEIWAPVPLHWIRGNDRGFNQSELLARELASRLGHNPIKSLLKRIRHTPAQAGTGVRARAANVKNAFAINTHEEIPDRVLLIDDVVTTGATVSECARVLKLAGVQTIRVLSFAKAYQ